MKFRLDFVTNSSSSSYTCDVCGNTEAGYDLSLNDVEMSECEHGHTICDYHIITDVSYKELAESVLQREITIIDRSIIRWIEERDRRITEGKEAPSWVLKYMEDGEKSKAEYTPWLEQLHLGQPLKDYDRNYKAFYEWLKSEVDEFKVPAQACPLCSFTEIADFDIKLYLMAKCGITKPELLEEIKNMFGTYEQFLDYIKPKSIER